MSPAKDLRDYVVAQGISTAATTFYGPETPGDPDELSHFRDTPGIPVQDFLGSTDAVETSGVQVVVRATSEDAGQTRAWALYTFLRKVTHVTINTRRYISVVAVSPPFALGRDTSAVTSAGSEGRPQWSLNFLVQRDIT